MDVADAEHRPDERAHTCAHLALLRLSDLGFETPANDVYVDPDKAIRLLWSAAGRSVELVFPSHNDEAPYLYRSDARDFGVEENPSSESLLTWLRWAASDLTA